MNIAVTNKVASRPRHAKTTAAIGSGSPHLRYWTGMRSQPTEKEKKEGKLKYAEVRFFNDIVLDFPDISLLFLLGRCRYNENRLRLTGWHNK